MTTQSLGAVVSMLVIAPLAMTNAQAVERHTLTGREVEIYNLVGTMRVERGSGSDVTIEVTRQGPDAARLRVATGEVRGHEALRVIYPERRIVFRSSDDSG